MAGIEFLDPDTGERLDLDADPPLEAPHESLEPPEPLQPLESHGIPSALRHVVAGLSALFWLAAVLTALIAPFRLLYRFTVGPAFADQSYQVDGWGRAHTNAVADSASQHGTRFGIVVYAAVVLLLLAATLNLRRHRPGRQLDPVGAAVALAAAGVIAGTVATAALEAQSAFDSVRASLNLQRLDPSSRSVTIRPPQFEIGGYVWLGVIAVGCTLLALVVAPLTMRAGEALAARAAARRPLPATAVEPGEELIGTDAAG